MVYYVDCLFASLIGFIFLEYAKGTESCSIHSNPNKKIPLILYNCLVLFKKSVSYCRVVAYSYVLVKPLRECVAASDVLVCSADAVLHHTTAVYVLLSGHNTRLLFFVSSVDVVMLGVRTHTLQI